MIREKEQGRRKQRMTEERKRELRHKWGGQEETESARPGQFLASTELGTSGGSGRRGIPRRRITEALATT